MNVITLLLPKREGLVWSQMVLIFCMFLMGAILMSGSIAGYSLFCDYAPKRRKAIMGSMFNFGEGFDTIVISLYYMYVSLEWSFLIWVVVIAQICFATL